MTRRTARAGLFIGWYTTLDGKKIRRIPRGDYPELYRLHRRYAIHRLGVNMFGCRSCWHHKKKAA